MASRTVSLIERDLSLGRRLGEISMLLVISLGLATCSQGRMEGSASGGGLKVVATTTIVGDVARQIGGEWIDLTVLLPVGVDTHAFEATPQDVARVAEADVVFANGAGLEVFLDALIRNAGGQAEIVYVSEGIELRGFGVTGQEAESAATDPHVWTDPNNVMVWTRNIERVLSSLDSAHAADYRANAEKFRRELEMLDLWAREQIDLIPRENRKLVTDHAVFGYLALRYGLEQVGTVVPGYTTLAQPSAQDLAALEDAIRAHNVKAVFVGNTVNPSLAERVAADTGVRLVFLLTESLAAPGSEAGTYLGYTRHNVSAIVEALR